MHAPTRHTPSPEACPAAGSPGGPPPVDATPETVEAARAFFPRGMEQPEGSFRYSLDALLLASFSRAGKARTFADLGTGCGVVGLAVLLGAPGLEGFGVELDHALANAARNNAARLGLTGRFTVHHADLKLLAAGCRHGGDADAAGMSASHGTGGIRHEPDAADSVHATGGADAQNGNAAPSADSLPTMPDGSGQGPEDATPPPPPPDPGLWNALWGSRDLVLANPPYRLPGTGRPAATARRNTALFETHGTLDAFTRTAARLLRTGGRFACVYGAARLPALFAALAEARLEPKRLRCVHSRLDSPASLVLVEAMHQARPSLTVEAPLVLYEGEGPATRLSPAALAFCPFLGCNARNGRDPL